MNFVIGNTRSLSLSRVSTALHSAKMGNEASLQMEMCSTFDADEIRRLGKRFKKLDLDNSGALSVDEFMSLPELQQNPLVQRVIDIFDTDGNGEVDFKEFIQGVSQFSVKGDKESKRESGHRSFKYLLCVVLPDTIHNICFSLLQLSLPFPFMTLTGTVRQ